MQWLEKRRVMILLAVRAFWKSRLDSVTFVCSVSFSRRLLATSMPINGQKHIERSVDSDAIEIIASTNTDGRIYTPMLVLR